MNTNHQCTAWLLLFFTVTTTFGQAPVLPPGNKEPYFRLEAAGPMSYVTALAFSPDGKTLYAGGWDKVVGVWRLHDSTGKFVLDEHAAYRVPIGPGLDGAINAIALSPDGKLLAVAGSGVVRDTATFRNYGKVFDRRVMTDEMRKDQGTIYVFDTQAQPGQAAVRLLRGHLGEVYTMSFAPFRENKPALLVSAAAEWDEQGERIGAARVWDVAQRKQLGSLSPLPYPQDRPGLAIWHTGGGTKQARVAVAWGDGSFYLWDVDRKALLEVPDVKYNNVAAAIADRAKLLTSSGRSLSIWDVGGPEPETQHQISFPPVGQFSFRPCALTLFASKNGGKLDHAAVVLQPSDLTIEYVLHILRINGGGKLASVQKIPLWQGEKLPVLAAAPDGKHLAVAGNNEHEIFVFPIAGLLAKQNQPPRHETLRGVGDLVREVAFVSNGKKLGLLLNPKNKLAAGNPPRAPEASDLIFDFATRKLSSDSRGWKSKTPALNGWQVDLQRDLQGEVRELTVRHNGEPAYPTIRLRRDQILTDYALLPKHKTLQIPLLAIATHQRGEPTLALYNVATGEQLREYTGHSERIRSLAFSADGRLLASAADDQTVSLWSLTDLDTILDRRGRLPGLSVTKGVKKDEVVINQIDEARLPESGLEVGDVVEGRIEGDKLQPFEKPYDFYDSVWRMKPEAILELKVRGKANARLTVRQGIDSQNPLLSLFVTRDDKLKERQWIGWSPLGPYESSGREAERHLGWHFNTGNAAAPTRFALADQYRKDFYRERILQELVEQGKPPSARAPQPPPRPNLTLWLQELGPDPQKADNLGDLLIRERRATLKMVIANYPSEKMEDWVESKSIRWQVDDDPWQAFDISGRESSVDLSGKLSWQRGKHRIQALVRTLELEPKEYTAELTLRYQPKPPKIELSTPLKDLVEKPDLSCEAVVAAPGQNVQVTVSHRNLHNDLIKKEQREAKDKLNIKEQLRLQLGQNEIEIIATNIGALAGYEEFETSRVSWIVTYKEPKKDPPPELSVKTIVPLQPDSGKDLPALNANGQAIVVHVPKVRIEGMIAAAKEGGNLTQADWDDARVAPQTLLGFLPGKHDKWTRVETLQPGTNKFRCSAKTANSSIRKMSVTIDYRPNLPEVVLEAPVDGLSLFEGKDLREVPFEARLIWPSDPHPCKAVIMVNGKETNQAFLLNPQKLKLASKVTLLPGNNSIQVRLRNDWKMADVSEPRQVRYLRPPRIIQFTGLAKNDKPRVDLEAVVISPLALTTDAEIEVNGKRTKVPFQILPAGKVQLKAVPLDPGENKVRLWLRNADARCLEPSTCSVAYQPPPKPPARPEVEILAPLPGQRVSEADVRVSFQIKSAIPLNQVELMRKGDASIPLSQSVKLRDLVQGTTPNFYKGTAEVSLLPGLNQLQVRAGNAGGEDVSAPVTVSYSRMPVVVVIDQLEPWGKVGPAIKPEVVLRNGAAAFRQKIPDGQLRLHGRIVGNKKNDPQLKKVKSVWVYINGIRQLPAVFDDKPLLDRDHRTFQVPILLNQKENQVALELVNVLEDAGDRTRFTVACESPKDKQRLHLIIVGVGTPDVQKLRDRALQAIRAKQIAPEQFTTPAFAEGYIYGPVTGSVNLTKINSILAEVESTIQDPAKMNSQMNDVVMFYFQGSEPSDAQASFHWSDKSWKDLLKSSFNETSAAHILFLDITRAAQLQDKLASWEDAARVGVLRYAWQGRKPPEATPRLITVLEKAMPDVIKEAISLKDIEAYVRDHPPENFSYDGFVPEDLKTLVIRKP